MRVVDLSIANVKRLTAVDITPDGDLVIVGGDNGQGKTSVLDAIWWALGGKGAVKGNTEPVRKGQKKAQVTLDLGDLQVTRTWDAEKRTSSLQVTQKEGGVLKSPQALLDKLTGDLTFDPLAFDEMAPKEQRDLLLAQAGVDLDEFDAEYSRTSDIRTEANRQVKDARTRYNHAALAVPADGDEVVSASSLHDLIRDRESLVTWQLHTERLAQEAHRSARHVEHLLEKLTAARLEQQEVDMELTRVMGDPPLALTGSTEVGIKGDLDRIDQLIATHEEREEGRKAKELFEAVGHQLDAATERSAALDLDLEKIRLAKMAALNGIEMPVEGLGVDGDQVTFGGIPLAQCSGAERLRISLAIAVASNPEIRVARIADGSLLDDSNLEIVREFAAANDFQVWIERVGDRDSMAVVIEDGEVRK